MKKTFKIFIAVVVVAWVFIAVVAWRLSVNYQEEQQQKVKELISKAISKHYTTKPHYDCDNLNTCEVCGCLIAAGQSVYGKKEIREKYNTIYREDYIYTPTYCKVHAPKVKK